MEKLAKRTFKGIDYIRIDSLPRQQADALIRTLNPRTLIKIQMFEEVVADCVLYEAYEEWHKGYQKETSPQTTAPSINKSVSLT